MENNNTKNNTLLAPKTEYSNTPTLGKFIVFEGIDGCGKGTQIKLASNYIFDMNKDHDVFLTREPTRFNKEIRKRMSEGTDIKKDKEWYAKMFIEDRRTHLNLQIIPLIQTGTHVLSDRYKHSTLAYQHTQGMDLNYLNDLHIEHLVPDLTFIFDCPAEIAFQRRKNEGATDIFDKDLNFQEKLRQNYLHLKQYLIYEDLVIINGEKSIEETFNEVKMHLDLLLKK